MSVKRSNEFPPGILDDALAIYGRIQRTRVEALYNLHRAVFAESLVATLLSGAELSPDQAHDFDIKWRTAGFDIGIEVKCSGEYLPRYGLHHRSPAEWTFPVQKRIWDYDSRKHVSNTGYRFDVLVLARHVGDALEAGWTFYVLNAVEAGEFGGRATNRSVLKLPTVSPVDLATAVRDAHRRLLAREVGAPNAGSRRLVECETSSDGDGVGWMSHESRRTRCPHCSSPTPPSAPTNRPWSPDQAQLAAAALLARYNGRTPEAYRHDLRYFFQWAADQHLDVLNATRAHIEVYRSTMEERGLAASTIDRRLTTVCGYYRFAHIDGRIPSNPAQYVRRPKVQPTEQHAMDRGERGRFLFTAEHYDRAHAALAVLLSLNGLRVSEACATDIENLAFERGHRTLRILGKGSKPAGIPLVPRTARTIDLAVGERHEGPILLRRDGQRLDRRTAHRWVRSNGKRAGLGHVHPHMLRAAFNMAALDAGVPLRDVQLAARHADLRTTTIYDRRRQNFDRHAAYVVVAFVASG